LFPSSTLFIWLNDAAYQLPNEGELLQEQVALDQEYKEKRNEIQKRIEANHNQYGYLHNLITFADEDLVVTVVDFLRWLGFENVVNVDERNPSTKDEDIQIETPAGLLVIEVKGLGGTSTDSDCSQISKIKYRRAEERGNFDVFALYLVNHQRYLPPDSRSNPPFNETQIQDARNDKRGLLSTYDLFKLHFNIENGFITKEDARSALFQIGLVQFYPSNATEVLIREIHYTGQVAIVQLAGTRIETGQDVIFNDHGYYRVATIMEIQKNDNTVDAAEDGEVGIRLDQKVSGKNLWLRKP
jgi:hypothetical protein